MWSTARAAHLQVFPVDGSGTVVATGLDSMVSLRLPEVSGVAEKTSAVAMKANLYGVGRDPGARPTFDRFDPSSYNNSTNTTVFDSAGNAMTLTNYFVRTEPPTSGNADTSKWEVHSLRRRHRADGGRFGYDRTDLRQHRTR